ncbi:MAG TPA: OpgC domain-containing protein [Candidatus Saccharimonadales bacterium]|nr:OpgC domain-containing protein [Candidatus Saccharimonadales bacterium]
MPKVSRIITLDLIRGYFLLVILINHLNRFPGIFDIFTGRGQLWTSAAEGFFMISGVLVGLVRGAEVKDGKFWLAAKKAWRRGLYLYMWAIGLTIFFTIIGTHFINDSGVKGGLRPIYWSNAGHIIWKAVILHYIYGWTDFLQYYAVYMILVPPVLLALRKRLDILVLAAAVFCLLHYRNFFLTWQFYFFAGMVIGYRWQAIEAVLGKLSRGWRTGLRLGLYAAALAVLAANFVLVFGYLALRRHYGTGAGSLHDFTHWLGHMHNTTALWFNRFDYHHRYGWARIFLSLLWFSALYVFVRRHESVVEKIVGWLMIPVGTNPLKVFIFEGIVVYAVFLIYPSKTGFLLNTLINTLSVAVVWLVARYKRADIMPALKRLRFS